MSSIDNIPVRQGRTKVRQRKRTNPLAGVFDEFMDFCQSRSLFMLHYCTGCGAIELPPAMTSRFDMERLGIQPMVTPRQADIRASLSGLEDEIRTILRKRYPNDR